MENNRQWPSYRGYFASGYLHHANLPDSFNIESSYHVKWNIEVPGLGLSCPVIWDDLIFITTAVSDQDKEGYLEELFSSAIPATHITPFASAFTCFDHDRQLRMRHPSKWKSLGRGRDLPNGPAANGKSRKKRFSRPSDANPCRGRLDLRNR